MDRIRAIANKSRNEKQELLCGVRSWTSCATEHDEQGHHFPHAANCLRRAVTNKGAQSSRQVLTSVHRELADATCHGSPDEADLPQYLASFERITCPRFFTLIMADGWHAMAHATFSPIATCTCMPVLPETVKAMALSV
eukprot:5883393-Amphidinium_carterae.2